MPIEDDDVEGFLAVVMEKADVTEAEYEKWVGHAEKTSAPDLILYKRHFLRHLLLKSVSWKETQQGKEKWEEKWKEPLQAWFMPLMHLAVYEPDPSFNRWFIEPALWACGYRRVLDVLFAYLEQGTNREKAGAARAFYWAWGLGPRVDREQFQQIGDERADLRRRADLLFLKTFVGCEDLDVQRPSLGTFRSNHPRIPRSGAT